MINSDWTTLKDFTLRENLSIQWTDNSDRYLVSASDGIVTYWTEIIKVTPRSPEQASFEDEYKVTGNRPQGIKITGEDGQYRVKVDSDQRLHSRANLQVGLEDISTINRVPTTDLLNLGFITAEKAATSIASIARVDNSVNQVGRKVIEIINTSNIVIYVGSSTVTTVGSTRGRPIRPNASYSLALSASIDLYIIAGSSATYVVVEGA